MHLSKKALKNLPMGKFVKFTEIHDMDRKLRKAVVWEFVCEGYKMAYFCVNTGEYLGEYLGGYL